MTDTYNPSPKFGVFKVIGRSVSLFFANFQKLFLYGFVPFLVSGGLSFLVVGDVSITDSATPILFADIFTPGIVVLGLIDVVIFTLVSAVLVMVSYDAAIGDRSTLAQYISHALKNAVPLVCLSVCLAIMAYLGFVAFVLPGLYVLAIFLVYIQAIVIDDAGWRGLHASAAMTKGQRWPVLATILIAGLMVLAPTMLLLSIVGIGGLAAMGQLPGVVLSAGMNAITYGFGAVFGTVIYLRLNEMRHGGNSRDLSEIFR